MCWEAFEEAWVTFLAVRLVGVGLPSVLDKKKVKKKYKNKSKYWRKKLVQNEKIHMQYIYEPQLKEKHNTTKEERERQATSSNKRE